LGRQLAALPRSDTGARLLLLQLETRIIDKQTSQKPGRISDLPVSYFAKEMGSC